MDQRSEITSKERRSGLKCVRKRGTSLLKDVSDKYVHSDALWRITICCSCHRMSMEQTRTSSEATKKQKIQCKTANEDTQVLHFVWFVCGLSPPWFSGFLQQIEEGDCFCGIHPVSRLTYIHYWCGLLPRARFLTMVQRWFSYFVVLFVLCIRWWYRNDTDNKNMIGNATPLSDTISDPAKKPTNKNLYQHCCSIGYLSYLKKQWMRVIFQILYQCILGQLNLWRI